MEKKWWFDSRQDIGVGGMADMDALSVGRETWGEVRERFVKICYLGWFQVIVAWWQSIGESG